MLTFRSAVMEDAPRIAEIYDQIHTREEAGLATTGWLRAVYPTLASAKESITKGDMFVAEENGRIVASGKINREQVPVYAQVPWKYEAPDEQVMVLHTLTVDPALEGRGIAGTFVRYYEDYALERGCPCLRIDTNEKNLRARGLYGSLGYREAGIVSCEFNGIPGVHLVCLEKYLEK